MNRKRIRRFGTVAAYVAAICVAFGFADAASVSDPVTSQSVFGASDFLLIPILTLQSLFLIAVLVQRRRRKQVEARLRESREIMTLAARSANLRFWSWDIERNRVWVTDHKRHSLAEPVSWSIEPLDCLNIVHPDDRPQFNARMKAALELATPFELEHRTLGPDGKVRWVRVRASAEANAAGKVVRMNGIVLDVTERKEKDSELDQQREMLNHSGRIGILGELSGALAHELNQPLAAILSNAQAAKHVLANQSPDLGELRNIVSDIIGDDNRARDVIAHLHSLLKKGKGDFKAVDLNAEIKLALTLARSELVRRQIEVTLILDPDLPMIWGDRVQVSQVLLNLILNAADAMRANANGDRFLTVTSNVSEQGAAQVSVRDNGPGIPAETVSRIFEPFYSTKAQGLGLGLSICRSIVAAHQGELWVRNNSGVGATFFVSFPHPKRKAA